MGSHARGKARQHSDIDLVLLCTEYESYLQDLGWANDFGKPASVRLEDYGKLTSVRVFYEEGPEIEFGFTQGLASPTTRCRNGRSPEEWIPNCL